MPRHAFFASGAAEIRQGVQNVSPETVAPGGYTFVRFENSAAAAIKTDVSWQMLLPYKSYRFNM